MPQHLDRQRLRRLWEDALSEDGFDRDVTSLAAVDETAIGTARIVAREAGVFAGSVIFELLREAHTPWFTVDLAVSDGDLLHAGTVIATLAGPMRRLLGIERTLLNFLQRLCGVATLTRRYVDAVAGTDAKLYDTRKTIPGWRQLDKYAVRCGGGHNHRTGLHDALLVKDNHLANVELNRLASVASEMISQASTLSPPLHFVGFEADTLEQLDELLKVAGIDVVMLDNFTPAQMREAVKRRDAGGLAGKVALEASGGVDLGSVARIAATGVERISVGAITHSVPAIDISMEIEPEA